MTVKRVSDHIYSLGIWLIIPIHVWVVVEDDGVTLVDAGIALMAKGILRFIDRLHAGPLKRILLTHGHSDHVGAVAAIQKVRQVPVFAHEIEIPYMEGRLPYPRRKRASAFLPEGSARRLDPARPGGLAKVGELTPYLTPGHSPGHVVYYHERDRVLLGGDLFTSRRGQLRRPMAVFTADMAQAVRSAEVLRSLGLARLEVCHGGPVREPVSQLDAYLAKWGTRK